ncbi:winged helix-turn-helix transcriptional regulator [Paenibacillus sp. V4I7]
MPLHVEYELTERGWNLQPIFAAMWAWVQENGLSAEHGAEEMA